MTGQLIIGANRDICAEDTPAASSADGIKILELGQLDGPSRVRSDGHVLCKVLAESRTHGGRLGNVGEQGSRD